MHWGGDETQLNRRTHIVVLHGSAYLIRDNEEIHADDIEFNQKTQYVKARGRVRYQYGETFVKADSIDLDLVKKTGVIINGNLTNGTYALRGSRMEQVGEQRYRIKDYDYTTCLDCPNSWEFTGSEVDLTVEGYAFIKDFMFKIKDASLLWLPYMVVPVKTKRQSGLLFPRFGSRQVYGLYYLQPYYWATTDWSDMTFTAGYLSREGTGVRTEWEGRYTITDRSRGDLNVYFTEDHSLNNRNYRYAGKAAITQELPFGIEGKLRINEVGDSRYPTLYSDDIAGLYEPALTSDLFFTRNTPTVSTVVSGRRIRNLLEYDRDGRNNIIGSTDFDSRTVQEFPRVTLNTNDQFIFGSKIAAGFEGRFNRFFRGYGSSDYLDPNGVDCAPGSANCSQIVREAQRFTFIPNLYTTFNPWGWLTITPTVQYRSYFYNFNNVYDNFAQGYLLTQTELSAQLERVILSQDPNISYKHTIRPTLTYNWIPTQQISDEKHPFATQISSAGRPGQYFDSNDIVPINSSQNINTYFTPLGNSLTYGFLTQLYRKEKMPDGNVKVERKVEASVQQTLDIQELERAVADNKADNRILLSPLFTHAQYDDPDFSVFTDYTYYAFIERYGGLLDAPSPHRFVFGTTWNLEKAIHEGVLQFDRSIGVSYAFSRLITPESSLGVTAHFSINDYIMLKSELAFDLRLNSPNTLYRSRNTVLFQSPSRCWRLELGAERAYYLGQGFSPIFEFALNLTGGSYGSP